VTKDAKKPELLNAFFALVFTGKTDLPESQVPEGREKVWSKEDLPSMEEDQAREHLNQTDIHNSIRPDRMNRMKEKVFYYKGGQTLRRNRNRGLWSLHP